MRGKAVVKREENVMSNAITGHGDPATALTSSQIREIKVAVVGIRIVGQIALGTHTPLKEEQILELYGITDPDKYPGSSYFNHRWDLPETLKRVGWIEQDICDLVIAGGADEMSRVTWLGFRSLLITDDEPCRPSINLRDHPIPRASKWMPIL